MENVEETRVGSTPGKGCREQMTEESPPHSQIRVRV